MLVLIKMDTSMWASHPQQANSQQRLGITKATSIFQQLLERPTALT